MVAEGVEKNHVGFFFVAIVVSHRSIRFDFEVSRGFLSDIIKITVNYVLSFEV